MIVIPVATKSDEDYLGGMAFATDSLPHPYTRPFSSAASLAWSRLCHYSSRLQIAAPGQLQVADCCSGTMISLYHLTE